ncbi:plasma-membrane choline transporter-domain-containing protein [Geopyxis carbonaria]|nr:plasma-membrane choline transporter-domain-containing protein [Geopyxis carbonaria]
MASYDPPPGPPPNHGASADYYGNSNAGGYVPPPQPTYGQNEYGGYGNGNGNGGYPPQQQQYPPPQPNYKAEGYGQQGQQQQQPQGPPPPYTTFEEKFAVATPKYNDLWAAILFLVTFFGVVVVSGLSLHGYASTRGNTGKGIYDNQNNFGLSTNTIILFAFVLGTALVLSFIYLMIARKFTKQLIWITAIANIVIGIATGVYYLSRRYYSAGIVFILFALFYAYCFYTWRSRIPFSIVMLQTAIDVARNFGHVFMVSFIGGLVALAAGAWFAVTFVAVYVKYTPSRDNPACGVSGGSCSSAKVIGLLVFLVFGFYWITEVIKNVMHTSVSGVYGSWYFCSRSQMPRHPTLGAFKRSMTYSFGSICFGSLLVALIQLLRQALSIARQGASQDGNLIGSCIFCCLECFVGLIQWMIEYFNHYAYSYIALYGDPYIKAAKATWTMMKDRGMDALVNDCLVDPVLTAGSTAVGYLCALLAYLYLLFTDPVYNRDGSFTVVVVAFAFLVGLQMANVFLVPIKSGVSTIFTSMAHSPEVLMRDHPELYRQILAVYPHVQTMIQA